MIPSDFPLMDAINDIICHWQIKRLTNECPGTTTFERLVPCVRVRGRSARRKFEMIKINWLVEFGTNKLNLLFAAIFQFFSNDLSLSDRCAVSLQFVRNFHQTYLSSIYYYFHLNKLNKSFRSFNPLE